MISEAICQLDPGSWAIRRKNALLDNDSMKNCRIGLFGVGLETSWPRFRGLKTGPGHYLAEAARKLARAGIEIMNSGMIDSPATGIEGVRVC